MFSRTVSPSHKFHPSNFLGIQGEIDDFKKIPHQDFLQSLCSSLVTEAANCSPPTLHHKTFLPIKLS